MWEMSEARWEVYAADHLVSPVAKRDMISCSVKDIRTRSRSKILIKDRSQQIQQ
jgi:hypothetical protein